MQTTLDNREEQLKAQIAAIEQILRSQSAAISQTYIRLSEAKNQLACEQVNGHEFKEKDLKGLSCMECVHCGLKDYSGT